MWLEDCGRLWMCLAAEDKEDEEDIFVLWSVLD